MQTGSDQNMQPDGTNSKQAETRTGVLNRRPTGCIRLISIKFVARVTLKYECIFIRIFVHNYCECYLVSYTYTGVGAHCTVTHI